MRRDLMQAHAVVATAIHPSGIRTLDLLSKRPKTVKLVHLDRIPAVVVDGPADGITVPWYQGAPESLVLIFVADVDLITSFVGVNVVAFPVLMNGTYFSVRQCFDLMFLFVRLSAFCLEPG